MAKRKLDQEFVKEGAEKMTEKEVKSVAERAEEIVKKFVGRSLGRFIEDAKLLVALVKDYTSRKYPRVPYGTVAAAAFTLIYVFNPFDIVPDFLPILGTVDDASVFAACLMLIERDLQKYRDWRSHQLEGE